MRGLFIVLTVIFSLSINAYANNDPFGFVDLNAPLSYQMANASNPEVYAKSRTDLKTYKTERAKDGAWNWLHVSQYTKITFSLASLSEKVRDTYYIVVRICQQGQQMLCTGNKVRSVEFNATDVGTSILDYKFSSFDDANWISLAELLEGAGKEQVLLAISLIKKAPRFYNADVNEAAFFFPLADLIQKQSAAIENKTTDLGIQLQVREIRF